MLTDLVALKNGHFVGSPSVAKLCLLYVFLVLFNDEGIYIAMALRDKECWQGVGHSVQSSDDFLSNATRWAPASDKWSYGAPMSRVVTSYKPSYRFIFDHV